MADSLGERAKTILVVNDKLLQLKLVVETLKTANFVVFKVDSEAKALNFAASHEGCIDLLIADSQVLGVSCPSLADALKQTRPDLSVMLTCGDILISSCGCALLQNPFMPVKLLEMINIVLQTDEKSHVTRQLSAGSSA
jgi:two-component system cell cycle sensor histidine kinase/response regulator CckA